MYPGILSIVGSGMLAWYGTLGNSHVFCGMDRVCLQDMGLRYCACSTFTNRDCLGNSKTGCGSIGLT